MIILLDAGHGGEDSGAVANGVKEKDINLSTATTVGSILKDNGHVVYFTRNSDFYLSPSDRLNLANRLCPDAFISIHCNASSDPTAHGIETLYRKPKDMDLARVVHRGLVNSLELTDRGIKNDIKDLGRRLAVLGSLDITSILIEIGFISNANDLRVIQQGATRVGLAVEQGLEEVSRGVV